MALKQSEESDSIYILRINEDRGEQVVTNISFKFGLPVKSVSVVNSLEEEVGMEDASKVLIKFAKEEQSVSIHVRPYKIISLALHF